MSSLSLKANHVCNDSFDERNQNDRLLGWIIFFFSFIAMSPVFYNLGLRGVHLLIPASIILYFHLYKKNFLIKKWLLLTFILLISTSTITALHWVDWQYLFAHLFLIFSLYLIQYVNEDTIRKIINIATFFVMLMLIMAVTGFVLAGLGIQPLLSFPNPDTRPNFFFYTTLTNVFFGNYIRPSGIYDEPGALSLYVCGLAVMRHLTGRNNKTTWLILLLGFITFSLAHLIYVFFHLLSEKFNLKNITSFIFLFLTTTVICFSTGIEKQIKSQLLDRLNPTENGSIKGDNRSSLALNATNLIQNKPTVFWFGADPSCRFNYNECRKLFPPMGENPFSPIAFTGIIVSFPYYLALVVLLLSPLLGRSYWVTFGYGLLLLQRPSFASLELATLSTLILYLIFNIKSSNFRKKNRLLQDKSQR